MMPRIAEEEIAARGGNALADITLAQVREIRYLNASDASTLFGTGNTGGAKQVVGKR